MEPVLSPSERIVTETVGRLIEFWGFKRNLGRVWALLYLSEEPLPTRDLRETRSTRRSADPVGRRS